MATILCIDDEPDALEIRKLLLESEGFRVMTALNGADGLRLLLSEKIDLAIVDYWMSGMKGVDVAREIKKISPAIAVVILSGFGELPGEAIGVADRWILKGRPTEELVTAIHSLLVAGGNDLPSPTSA